MIRLSAFADEISPDLDEQIAVLQGENLRHLDLRGVWNTNVLKLTDQQVRVIKTALDAGGIRVAAIASPIGKVPVDVPLEQQIERLDRAITLATVFETPLIRIFSYYPPASNPDAEPGSYRDAVMANLRVLTDRATDAGVTLLHENDSGLYGDTIARNVDVLQTIRDPHLAALLDPANYLLSGDTPYADGYQAVRSRLGYVHVKDAKDGAVVGAGEGEGRFPELLRQMQADRYNGIFSLEPHLGSAGPLRGFSGPDLFRHASQAFQRLLQAEGWAYQ